MAERLTTAWAERAMGRRLPPSASAAAASTRPRARRWTRGADEPVGADLVLTMTRRPRHGLLKSAPRAMRKTFTLPEAAALVELADLSGVVDLPLAARGAELALRLNAARTRRPACADDDIDDPPGLSAEVHAAVARQIAASLSPLAGQLFAAAPAVSAAGYLRS